MKPISYELLEVTESIVINASAAKVWELVGNWEDMLWHPGFQKSTAVPAKGGSEPNATRKLYLSPELIVHETLTDYQPGKSYSYVITKVDTNAVPVNKYSATISVAEEDGKTTLSWSGDFLRGDLSATPNEKSTDAASKATVSAIFIGGLENVKMKVEGK